MPQSKIQNIQKAKQIMNENKQSFIYTYSAEEQKEIRRIRDKYTDSAPKDTKTEKIEKIRRLDSEVTRHGMALAISLGIVSTLILGSGMSLIMTDLGELLNIVSTLKYILGIILGAVGIAGMILANPLYRAVVRAKRKKLAPEILKLTDAIMENKEE